jgi:hypothetical protein
MTELAEKFSILKKTGQNYQRKPIKQHGVANPIHDCL